MPLRVRKDKPLSDIGQARQKILKSNRAALDSGHIVLHLRRMSYRGAEGMDNAEHDESSSGGWLSMLLGEVQDEQYPGTEFWFHIGYVNYVSWQLSCLQLQLKDEQDEISAARLRKLQLPLDEDLTKAIQISPGHFCDLIDFNAEWVCTVYAVVDNDDSLPQVARACNPEYCFSYLGQPCGAYGLWVEISPVT